MTKILALWATFRSISTAFERMMRERGDFTVFHEPFGLSCYCSQDRKKTNRYYPHVEIVPENNYQAVWEKLQETAKQEPVFIKDMPYYLNHLGNEEFLSHFENTFIIRNPSQMLPSLYNHWEDFTLDETGYEQLYNFFVMSQKATGKIPIVINAEDLVQQPEKTVQAYCQAVGIKFIPEALEWKSQEKSKMNSYLWEGDKWHQSVKSSSGFQSIKNNNYISVEDNEYLQKAYDFCWPFYEKMHEHCLVIN